MTDKKYKNPKWAVKQIERIGMIEDICEHGVGHPNEVWLNEMIKIHGKKAEKCFGIHGCDGCCGKLKTKKL